MSSLGYAESFAKYGARLKNVNWSVCAEAPDGSLVVSFWSHHFKKNSDGELVCVGRASRWNGPGRNEFCDRMTKAYATKQAIRVVIAATPYPERVEAGEDASKLKATFRVRQELVGEVLKFDGEEYEVVFRKAA
jgi:hypothetical protein